MPSCYVSLRKFIEVIMFEALLSLPELDLPTVVDAIDIYEGSIPPSAIFQVVDVDNTTEVVPQQPTGGLDAN